MPFILRCQDVSTHAAMTSVVYLAGLDFDNVQSFNRSICPDFLFLPAATVLLFVKFIFYSKIFRFAFSDLLTNCENELLNNESLFSDENLLSELDESSLPLESGDLEFSFLNSSPTEMKVDPVFHEVPNPKQNVRLLPAPVQPPMPCLTQMDTSLPLQQAVNELSSIPKQEIRPAQTTVFGSHYTIAQNLNFNVPSPVVTLAPVTTQQRQLLLPAKLIKSEPLVYSTSRPQTINTTPVQHHIHTLVNTGNGTVLATGNFPIQLSLLKQ